MVASNNQYTDSLKQIDQNIYSIWLTVYGIAEPYRHYRVIW